MLRVGREEAGLLSLTLCLFTSQKRVIFKLGSAQSRKKEVGGCFKLYPKIRETQEELEVWDTVNTFQNRTLFVQVMEGYLCQDG